MVKTKCLDLKLQWRINEVIALTFLFLTTFFCKNNNSFSSARTKCSVLQFFVLRFLSQRHTLLHVSRCNTGAMACLHKLLSCLLKMSASLLPTCECHATVMVKWTHHILTTVLARKRFRVKGPLRAKWIMNNEASLANGQISEEGRELKVPLHNDGHA